MPEIAALSVAVTADTSQLEAGLNKANQSVQGFGSQLSSIGTAAGAALAGVGVAAAAGLGAAVKTAMDFEKQMSAVGSVMDKAALEAAGGMDALTKSALQAGKDTSFSALEAAKGFEELAKAGVSAADIIGGAGRASLDLAAAGAVSVADAAEIASNAMNVFNKRGAEMTGVVDTIAGAANASAIGVNDYKFSLSAAGAVAATVGLSFEDLSTAIALMGQAGIKGSDAGTSLKTMLLNLQPSTDKQAALFKDLGLTTTNVEQAYQSLVARGITPASHEFTAIASAMQEHLGISKDVGEWTAKDRKAWEAYSTQIGLTSSAFFDANGQVKSLAQISDVLREKLGGMTKAQQLATLEALFGADAVRAGAVLLEAGAEGADKMAAAIKGVGSAQSVANERLNNLAGSLEMLKGSLETGAIILGSLFTPALKVMADQLTVGVNRGIEIIEQLPDAWRTIGQVMADAWEPSELINPFVNEVGKAAVALKAQFGPAIQAVSTFLTGTLGPAIETVGNFFAEHTEFVISFVTALGTILGMAAVQAVLAGIAAAIALLLSPIALVTAAITLLVAPWVGNWFGIQEAVATAWAAMEPAFTALVDWLGVQIPPVIDFLTTVAWPAFVTAAQAVGAFITGTLIPAFTQVVLWLGTNIPPVVTWISETGWPALVTAGTAVATFITGTLIPGITQLIDWLGPKLVPVVTWISDTGWPALVTAGTAVGAMVQQVITFFQALYVELEKRGVFTELGTIWDTLVSIGEKVWAMIQKVIEVLTPLFEWVSKLIATATGVPALVAAFGFLADKAGLATGPVNAVATAIQSVFTIIQTQLKMLETFLGMLDRLSSFKMPSFNFGGPGGGGATQLSMTTGGGSGHVGQYLPLINQVSAETGVPADVLAALMEVEGSGAGSTSPAGARGLMQVMPNYVRPGEDPFDPLTSIRQGARAVTEKFNATGSWSGAGRAYFGYGVDAGGMDTNTYGARYDAARQRYQQQQMQPGNVPMVRIPLGGPTSGAPGADPSQWPGFMQQTNEQLPDYLMSLDTIQQAGTLAFDGTAQAALTAGKGMVSASTDALGNVTRIYSDATGVIGATITNAAGVIVNQWGVAGAGAVTAAQTMQTGVTAETATLATNVAENTNLMVSGALTSVTALGTGTLTTVQTMSGTTIATVTDMQGQVTSQYATMANGATLQANGMQAGTLTSVTQMHDGTITTVQDMAGNAISTVTDMAGNVTNQYTTLASEGGASAHQLASETTQSFGEIKTAAGEVPPAVKAMGDSWKNLPKPNVSGIVSEFKKIASAAEDAMSSVDKLADKTGVKSGSGKSNPFGKGKAAGGPVDMGQTYLVGEEGPELFTPSRSGSIIPNNRLGTGGGIDYDALAAAIARAMPRGNTYHMQALPGDSLWAEADKRARKDELMYRIGG